jgi:hypothetical protein
MNSMNLKQKKKGSSKKKQVQKIKHHDDRAN